MRFSFFLFFCLGIPFFLSAQIAISGRIIEKSTQEPLSYVSVYDTTNNIGTLSNNYGFYTLPLQAGNHTICFSLEGYTAIYYNLDLYRDTLIQVSLLTQQTDTVTITDTHLKNAKELGTSKIYIPIEQIKKMPSLAGEADALKSLQLLPGVQFGVEGTTGLFIRGGTPDQNLILLDEIPVYNVNHLFGFFSLFSPDALKSVELIKGGFPAQYGGRLSSVINLQTKEGNKNKKSHSFSISPLAVHAHTEGGFSKGKGAYFFSARRSLIDAFLRPITQITYKNLGVKGYSSYYFYDFIAKISYDLSKNDKIYVSVYGGQDKNTNTSNFSSTDSINKQTLSINNKNILKWGNFMASCRYNKIINDKYFSNTILGLSFYDYIREASISQHTDGLADTKNTRFSYISNIKDFIFKQSFSFFPSEKHAIQIGLDNSYKIFKPDINFVETFTNNTQNDTSISYNLVKSNLLAFFGEDKWRVNNQLSVSMGLRTELFTVNKQNTFSLQPRISLRYGLSENMSVKASYSYIKQYLHLLTNNGLGLPADLWVPATQKITPASSHQWVLGIYKDYPHHINVSIEGYYKQMNNLIDYKEGASFANLYTKWEDKVTIGSGFSYGGEFFIHKTTGKWNGWLSYTLSWNERRFPDINNNKIFPFKYDRRHNISLFVSRQLKNPRKNISFTWMYVSGARATIPTNIYTVPPAANLVGYTEGYLLGGGVPTIFTLYQFGNVAMFAPQRNNYQMAPYHKLDIAYQTTKTKEKYQSQWTLGIYNLYARRNPYYLYYQGVPVSQYQNGQTQFLGWKGKIMEYSYLIFIPSIGYAITF